MDKGSSLALFLLLLLRHDAESHISCPYKCQCFSADQVLCADDRMTSVPRDVSGQVKDLIIMTSAMDYLFPSSFEGSPQLTKLVLFNNALRSIHSQAFQNLTALQELEVSGNPWLENLFLGTFSTQRNLTKLLLNYNRFSTVLPGMFDSLKLLETLQLKHNMLADLPPLLFLNLHNLRVLDLSLNRLTQVDFSGLARLEVLKMSNNYFRNISSDTFQNVPQLKELSLEWNMIEELEEGVFSGLSGLRVLNLRGNLLRTFSDRVFGSEGSSLKELNLRGNRLSTMSSLSSLTSLTDIILSSNMLTTLPEDIFRNVTDLESVDLSENQLSSLPETIFNDLLGMRMVNLHKNHLSEVHAKLFKDQEFIQQLYLSDNQLKSLPMGFFDTFDLQHIIRLHGNPWRCDCHMWYLHDWVLRNFQNVEMLERVLCESPEALTKQTVASVEREQMVCRASGGNLPDLRSCSVRVTNDMLLIKCQADKCSPLTVKVQFEDEDGSVTEHVVRNEQSDPSQCSNETLTTE